MLEVGDTIKLTSIPNNSDCLNNFTIGKRYEVRGFQNELYIMSDDMSFGYYLTYHNWGYIIVNYTSRTNIKRKLFPVR